MVAHLRPHLDSPDQSVADAAAIALFGRIPEAREHLIDRFDEDGAPIYWQQTGPDALAAMAWIAD